MYLRCITSARPKEWLTWFPWAECCYDTSYHSSIKMSSCEAVYGKQPSSIPSYIPGSATTDNIDQQLKTRDQHLEELQENLKAAQQRMKLNADKHPVEGFNIDDWVYLRLHPFRQTSWALDKHTKLSPKFWGPCHIVGKLGTIAYKLELRTDENNTQCYPCFALKRKSEV